MIAKRAFLLSKAHQFKLENVQDFYDEKQQLNVVVRSGQIRPVVSENNASPTQFKTYAAPGDDCPDPEDEACY